MSCKEEDVQTEGALDCSLGPNYSGICLNGPEIVEPGSSNDYIFKIEKRQQGDNINKVVNWSVESGEIEIVNIETEVKINYTVSVATLKFKNNFTGGSIKASSNENMVDSPPENPTGYISIPIYAK